MCNDNCEEECKVLVIPKGSLNNPSHNRAGNGVSKSQEIKYSIAWKKDEDLEGVGCGSVRNKIIEEKKRGEEKRKRGVLPTDRTFMCES